MQYYHAETEIGLKTLESGKSQICEITYLVDGSGKVQSKCSITMLILK